MKPRKALLTSAAVAATLVSASAAMALNGGILDTSADGGVGTLDPAFGTAQDSPTAISIPRPITIAVSDTPAVTTSSASTVSGSSDDHEYDRSDDDDRYESDDDDDDDDDDD